MNTLDISAFPWTGTYFNGVPITVTAVPKPGYIFAGWSDNTLPNTSSITIDPQKNYTITPLFTRTSDTYIVNGDASGEETNGWIINDITKVKNVLVNNERQFQLSAEGQMYQDISLGCEATSIDLGMLTTQVSADIKNGFGNLTPLLQVEFRDNNTVLEAQTTIIQTPQTWKTMYAFTDEVEKSVFKKIPAGTDTIRIIISTKNETETYTNALLFFDNITLAIDNKMLKQFLFTPFEYTPYLKQPDRQTNTLFQDPRNNSNSIKQRENNNNVFSLPERAVMPAPMSMQKLASTPFSPLPALSAQ